MSELGNLEWNNGITGMHRFIYTLSPENQILLHANNKGADQTAYLCSLFSVFVIDYLGSLIAPFARGKISLLLLVSVAKQARMCLTL